MTTERIDLLQQYRGRQVQNTFYVSNPEGSMPLDVVANNIEAAWIPPFRGSQFTSHLYHTIIVTRVLPTGNPLQHVKAINILGTGSSLTLHGSLSYVIKFGSGLAGRKNRGRYYIAGVASGFFETSTEIISAAGNTFFTNMCNQLKAAFTGNTPSSGLGLVIWHRGPEPSTTSVVQITQRSVLGLQRRRNVGVGS